MNEDEKRCPRCAENIKRQAEVCRFCGYEFFKNPFFERQTPWRLNGCSALIAIALIIIAIFNLRACTDSNRENDVSAFETPVDRSKYEIAQSPRFTAAAIEAVQKGVEEEPKAIQYLFDPQMAVELTVAVEDDGTRRNGYAGYYCQKLREWGAYDEEMDVRIVDAARLAEADGDFRSISLGTVHCADNSFLD